MKNNGLFSSLFIEDLKKDVTLDDAAQGRMATLAETWRTRKAQDTESLWESFLKKAMGYLEFVPSGNPVAPGLYPLYADWGFSECISVLYLVPPSSDIDDTSVGRFYPAKLMAQLKVRKCNWGILTNGSRWRLYSTKTSRPYEDFVELSLAETLEGSDEAEYGLFESFFHRDSFIAGLSAEATSHTRDADDAEATGPDKSAGIYKCRLDHDRDQSEQVLEERVKKPFLAQVDEVLQYICNGFIFDTRKSGEEYTEKERAEIFESAVKLIYRCLFLFYAEARRLLPTDPEKTDLYQRHSIKTLCLEAHKFRWGTRHDMDQYDLWKHLKGLINAVNDGDPEYGIMGYNGGLFDDEEERFLGRHQLRNDFLYRALYLLAFVEPFDNEPDGEYSIPYEDLEVRHLGELHETILEYTVQLADADRIRRRTKKGIEIVLVSQTQKRAGDTLIRKGDVYFGESALERKQTGSYYTPESLVRFLNEKTIIQPLREKFEQQYRQRFNDFLEQASAGYDIGTRRGATQSAAMLVERFAEDEILKFKVCDLAMGSGHFLVDAANQMSGLVVAFLAEVPYIEGMTVSVSSDPNYWRRRITRHCIYGVDLNPLAVNLAKLSLWLNCFATHHRLTFLDHHLRCGNSLIGIRSLKQLATIPERKKDGKKKKDEIFGSLFPNFQQYATALTGAGQDVQSISEMDEDKTGEQKSVFDQAQQKVSDLKSLANLYTSYLMDGGIRPDDYHTLFYSLAKKQSIQNSLNPDLPRILESVATYQDRHHFFHWPLEFPDVFGPDGAGGFSATVGNPPWDVVSPNSSEFFLSYDPEFRSYGKQKANQIIEKLKEENPTVSQKWDMYWNGVEEQREYYRGVDAYCYQGKGDINTFKLFIEQSFALLAVHGRLEIIVPSSFYTDQGCQPLRELFFNQSRVEFLYCFENRWPTVFTAVDGRFKFVTFGTQKGGQTDRFKCAFMAHDPWHLPVIDRYSLSISIEQIKVFSPLSMSLPEFSNEEDVALATKLYKDNPLLLNFLKSHWDANFQREFHMTGDSHLFIKPNGDKSEIGIFPLFEGKQLWILSNHFCEPINWMKKANIEVKNTTAKTRIAYRALAAATNERTYIVAVLPSGYPTGHTINVCPLPDDQAILIASIQSSVTWDWLVRSKVTTSISIFVLEQLPFPDYTKLSACKSDIVGPLMARGCRLVCTDGSFDGVWKSVFSNDWISQEFWYPLSAPIDTYGPAHEQEIRRRLRDEAKNLTPEWGPQCGVHDRLPDRRDTGDRAQLRAEIDAYVAHLYGLTRDDFAYILDTFPVLKKKEEKAFGEFMSKRKCLEEYERIEKLFASGYNLL